MALGVQQTVMASQQSSNQQGSNTNPSAVIGNTETPTATPKPTLQGKIVYVEKINGHDAIFVMNAGGSNPVHLTNNQTDDWRPIWSPDGQRIAFISY